MKKIGLFLLVIMVAGYSSAQTLQRPKLVVGIVVDQMRWDFLYRYHERYAQTGGFKRLLSKGFSCENTFIPYAPTVTACGHASIYTGSVPSINGITGNYWWDSKLNRGVYCTEDSSVITVGSNTEAGLQSPRNLFTSSICDELKLATNFRSKVIGISLKDRGSILAAGHTADAAYWYDSKTGAWITSSYYMKDLPEWVKNFNNQKRVDKYYKEGWKTLYPVSTYRQSMAVENRNRAKSFGPEATGFPYHLSKFAGNDYGAVSTTPFGNTLTIELAKAAITSEQLGTDSITDFLTLSFSSPDYVGHSFGPNSIEVEDIYLRLDRDLGELLDFFDNHVGKDQYLVFLSADHGVAHVPAFAREHRIPAGTIDFNAVVNQMNESLKQKFGRDTLVIDILNYQVHFNLRAIESSALKLSDVKNWSIEYLSKLDGVSRVFDIDDLFEIPLNAKLREKFSNGYYPNRCGQIQLILHPQWLDGFASGGTSHGLWNPYDAHIPLIWYGWGIKAGKTNKELYMTDIAPTLAALLHIQMPNGSVGNVIHEIPSDFLKSQ